MIIPPQTRTIHLKLNPSLCDVDLNQPIKYVVYKFKLNIPQMELKYINDFNTPSGILQGYQFRPLQNNQYYYSPLTNTNKYGIVCTNTVFPNLINEKECLNLIYSTYFNTDLYQSVNHYFKKPYTNFLPPPNKHVTKEILELYQNWEKDGHIKLIPENN
jgi:hypothetical protein